MRLLAVGDIHGYLNKLTSLMDLVVPELDDRVVFLGDYIDRGPDSPGVIQYLIDFSKKFPRSIFLGGNHEHLLALMLHDKKLLPKPQDTLIGATGKVATYRCIGDIPPFNYHYADAFNQCGGRQTVEEQYGGYENMPTEHVSFIAECRLYYEEIVAGRTYFFVHAGIAPECPFEKQRAENLLWIKDSFYNHSQFAGPETDFGFGGRIIVHGHDALLGFSSNTTYRINVDSGVYLDTAEYKGCGKLTCCDILSQQIWQL